MLSGSSRSSNNTIVVIVVVVILSPWKLGHRIYEGIKQEQCTCTALCT